MGTNTKVGPNQEPAKRFDYVVNIDPETGLPVVGGGGGGSGDASASNQVTGNTRLGDLTETAPASDTASSGLNGRLQRIAQRLTALITALTDGTARMVLNAGSAIIGKVGIDQTTPGTTNGVVIKDSSGNAIDQTATINVAQDSAVMKLAAVSVTPKFAKIALSASGDPIAAVTGKKIRVLAYNIMGAGAVNAKFQSNASTDLTGLKYIAAAGGGICAPFNPVGWFETISGEKLTLNLSASVGVGGEITYIEV